MIRQVLKQISETSILNQTMAELITEADHIHNKAIFDAIKVAMKSEIAKHDSVDSLLESCREKVLDWASIQAGSTTQQMAKLLQSEVAEQEEQWQSEFEAQVDQVMDSLTKEILEQLLDEQARHLMAHE